jgi:hypothetical protein
MLAQMKGEFVEALALTGCANVRDAVRLPLKNV